MCRQYWNDVLIEESLEERHLISNVEKHVQDIKFGVGVLVLKRLLKLDCIVCQILLYQVTFVAYVFSVITIIKFYILTRIIATSHLFFPFFFFFFAI